MAQPRIFVSSTILDFEDLRSALKFYLSEFKYDVQMSEYPDFDVSPENPVFEACINNLKSCVYFILLIGYRRGSWFIENEVSITHQEYRSAKSLIESGHPLRIITFVRRPIFALRNERKAFNDHFQEHSIQLSSTLPSSIIDDPEYIFDFLDEVSQGITFPGSESPSNNWIYDFSSFEDIVTALKHTFNISDSLDSRRLKSLFLRELRQNKKKFEVVPENVKITDYPNPNDVPMENLLQIVADRYAGYVVNNKGKLKNLGQDILFPGKELGWVMFYVFLLPVQTNLRNLETRILRRVIEEGLFWSFDITSDYFKADYFITVLEKLYEMIDSFTKFHESPISSDFSKDLARITSDGSSYQKTIRLPTSIAITILIQAKSARIYDLIVCILDYLEKDETQQLLDFDFSDDYIKKYNKST